MNKITGKLAEMHTFVGSFQVVKLRRSRPYHIKRWRGQQELQANQGFLEGVLRRDATAVGGNSVRSNS